MSSIPHPPSPQTLGVVSAGALVRALLFLVILSSGIVLIEPAPYEGLVLLFAATCVVLGIGFDRRLVPLLLLMLLWMAGGVLALVPYMHEPRALIYLSISIYLKFTAILFACVFAADTERRLATLRTAYILAALIVAMIGILAFFRVMPGADLFLFGGRAASTFEDPNLFAPFLILPLMLIIAMIFERGPRLRYVAAAGILLVALVLSFSRGGWAHFMLSTAVLCWLMFVTAESPGTRWRIAGLGIAAGVGLFGLLVLLMSVSAVGDMFVQRAVLLQEYDAGPGGRFGSQIAGLMVLLERPNGLGFYEFGRQFGEAPHNVYLKAFAAYGWLGGFSYVALIIVTLAVGFRAALVRTPWQTSLICVFATFVGIAGEGVVIDTDRWRHFFLLLGLMWGLAAATERYRRPGAVTAAPSPGRPPSSPPRSRYRSLPG